MYALAADKAKLGGISVIIGAVNGQLLTRIELEERKWKRYFYGA